MERNPWFEWLSGLLAALLIGYVLLVIIELDPDTSFGTQQLFDALVMTVKYYLPGAALGGLVILPVARGFGWSRQWPAVAAVGTLVGVVSALYFGSVL